MVQPSQTTDDVSAGRDTDSIEIQTGRSLLRYITISIMQVDIAQSVGRLVIRLLYTHGCFQDYS